MTETTTETMTETMTVERHGYLFGHPIAHSMSPLLHQTVYDNLGLNWSQYPLDSTDMDLFLELIKDPKFYGARDLRQLPDARIGTLDLQIRRSFCNHASQGRNSQAS